VETQKSLKDLQENTNKQVMELIKIIQDLKMEVETIKKTQREITLEIETVEKKSGTIDQSINNKIQEMEQRISGAEHSIEDNNNQRKGKMQKDPNSKHLANPGHKEETKPTDNRSR
jgi:chromosome segregation ATPase